MEHISTTAPEPARKAWFPHALWLVWFLALCFVPDPRPLGAPEWAVGATRALTGVSEPTARALSTIALRCTGLAVLGILFLHALAATRMRRPGALALILTPLLAVASLWANYGYYPIRFQIMLAVASAVAGVLVGLALQKNRSALLMLAGLAVGTYVVGTSTGISDDLHASARATALHLLDMAEDIPSGDEGFVRLMEEGFAFAEDNSHGTDPVHPNKAAILALSVILGEERVADMAKRTVDPHQLARAKELRKRVTLHGRKDLSQHFWVSAGLTILSDQDRSIAVGLTKEMMDATPGGSGFSFVDLTADQAGNLFALAATRNQDSARATQGKVRELRMVDVCPPLLDLPEQLTSDQLQADYGGLGGEGTTRIIDDIRARLASCAALQ